MKILLIPLSYLFRIIVSFRNFFYNKGIFKIKGLDAKVISVGNIAAGGTGKTPFVELLAEYLLKKGVFIVILLKGYKREHDDIKVVELGFKNEALKLSAESLGDEAFVLLENLSVITAGKGLLVVGDDKTKAAKFANGKFNPQIIIIDDGFQHRKLSRDLDIVIVNPDSDKYLIPAGNLREPMKNIRRADLIVVNNKFDTAAIVENTKSRPKIECNYVFNGFTGIESDMLEQGAIDATVFCGIGEPESFRKLMKELKVNIKDFIVFPDHHSFSINDINGIIDSHKKTKSSYILTTHKDFVRIRHSELVLKAQSENSYKNLLFNYPLYYAKIKMQINQNAELLYDEVDDLIR